MSPNHLISPTSADVHKLQQIQALNRLNLQGPNPTKHSTAAQRFSGLVSSPSYASGLSLPNNFQFPMPTAPPSDVFTNTPPTMSHVFNSPTNLTSISSLKSPMSKDMVSAPAPKSKDFLPSNLLYTDMMNAESDNQQSKSMVPTANMLPTANATLVPTCTPKEEKKKTAVELLLEKQRQALSLNPQHGLAMPMMTSAGMPALNVMNPFQNNLYQKQASVLSPTSMSAVSSASATPTLGGAVPGTDKGGDYERAWNGYDKKDVCRHWLKGKCTFGNNCVFAHELRVTSYTVDVLTNVKEEDICRHFLLGRCTYGKSCSFLHAMRQNNGFTQTYSPY